MRKIIILISTALVILGMWQQPAKAQIDPQSTCEIFQNGKQTGQIFVPERDSKNNHYMEYWYLFNNYSYPGETNPITTELKCSKSVFTALGNFESKMKFDHPDGYMIQITVDEKR